MVRPRKPEAERRSDTTCVRVTAAEAAETAERAGATRMTRRGRGWSDPGRGVDQQQRHQVALWANIHKRLAEAIEVVARMAAIEQSFSV